MISRPLLILCSFVALATLVACTNNESPITTDSTEPPVAATTIPTESSMPIETAAPVETPITLPINDSSPPEWTTHTLDLYSLQLELPTDWAITELNRQEEPTEGGLVLGHDCAEYTITNADNTLQLHLSPACGLGEGANFLCPPDTIVIGAASNGSELVRFYDSISMNYGYTEADSELTYCADSPRLSFMDGDVQTYMEIAFDYTGNEENLPQLLETTDKIISSVDSQS